jgi:hypothetical protein
MSFPKNVNTLSSAQPPAAIESIDPKIPIKIANNGESPKNIAMPPATPLPI